LGPECFSLRVAVVFDNSDYDGQIPVKLLVLPKRRRCPEPRGVTSATSVALRCLNVVVAVVCAASAVLCGRSMLRAQKLRLRLTLLLILPHSGSRRREAQRVFGQRYGWVLTNEEKMDFVNWWYVLIVVNDVLLLSKSYYPSY